MNLESDYVEGEDDGDYGMDLRTNTEPFRIKVHKSRKSTDLEVSLAFNRYLIETYNERSKR